MRGNSVKKSFTEVDFYTDAMKIDPKNAVPSICDDCAEQTMSTDNDMLDFKPACLGINDCAIRRHWREQGLTKERVKLSLEMQQMHQTLVALDAAEKPYTEGEDTITTIARSKRELEENGYRSVISEFLEWYLYDYTYPGEVLGDKEVLINNFINYKFKKGN